MAKHDHDTRQAMREAHKLELARARLNFPMTEETGRRIATAFEYFVLLTAADGVKNVDPVQAASFATQLRLISIEIEKRRSEER